VTIDLLGTCFPETKKGDVALAACPVNLNGVSYESTLLLIDVWLLETDLGQVVMLLFHKVTQAIEDKVLPV